MEEDKQNDVRPDDALAEEIEAAKGMTAEDLEKKYGAPKVAENGVRSWDVTRPGGSFTVQVGKSRNVAAEKLAMMADMDHPARYNAGDVECIDAMESMAQGYKDVNPAVTLNVIQAMKYLWRAPLKGNMVEDLCKAIRYAARALKNALRQR